MTNARKVCTRAFLLSSALLTPLALAATPARAAVQGQPAAVSFNIPAQDLGSALTEFARQSRQQLLYSPELVRGKRSTAVVGRFSAEAGLRQLLSNSEISLSTTSSGAFLLSAAGIGDHASGAEGGMASEAASTSILDRSLEQDIVVTGTHIRGRAPSGASLIVLNRRDLDSTGRSSLAEAIQTLPQVHGGGANAATTRTGTGAAANTFGDARTGESSLNLRGLGVEETLTLVNGRRIAPAGIFGAFADVSAIPIVAVERVEILPDGASATYGADAMAGVVNIILNRRFKGAETRLRAGVETRSGQPEYQASHTFGSAFDRGNILISADFSHRDGITSEGRPFAASGDLRRFGGTDRRGSSCSPGNISSPSTLAGAIPDSQDGRALTPDQIRSGELNRCDTYPTNSFLTPETRKASVYIAGSYDINQRLTLSADVLATRSKTKNVGAYQSSRLRVPASNAFRQMNGFHGPPPLDQDIIIDYLFAEVDPTKTKSNTSSLITTLAADYEITDRWSLVLQGSYGAYDSESTTLLLDSRSAIEGNTIDQALSSNDPITAFNPFGDRNSNSPNIVRSFFSPQRDDQNSYYRSLTASLSGPIADLPGGSVILAIGADYRKEIFKTRGRRFYSDTTPLETATLQATREVKAAYAELAIPLFSRLNPVGAAHYASASISARYDDYSDFGSTLNPKIGLTWAPVEDLTFKGSYGTSFKAPLFRSLYSSSRALFYKQPLAGGPDQNNDGFVDTLYVSGGNRNLKPEKGKSWSIGVELDPAMVPGLELKATYFHLRFTGRFASASNPLLVFGDTSAYEGIAYFPSPPQSHVDNLVALADQVIGIAPPTGVEAIIDGRTLNFASQVMSGIDAGASYSWNALGGTLRLSGSATYIADYKSRLGESVSETNYVSNVGLPTHWKARAGFSWIGDSLQLNGWLNHTGSYKNRFVRPSERVDSYATLDLSARLRIGALGRGLLGDKVWLTFYVTNVLDESPPFVDATGGFDGANADPIGRRLAIQLSKTW